MSESPFKVHVLASGSKGNATIIENSVTGESFLIDCGICKREFFARCDDVGFDPASLCAVLITHAHTDHTKGIDVVLRGLARLDIRPTLYMGESVYSKGVGQIDACARELTTVIHAGEEIKTATISVAVFPTSHDCGESFGFRCTHTSGSTLGYVTDTGIIDDIMLDYLSDCSLLALESNHDLSLLSKCAYPYVVKNRIRSDTGHLSNEQASCVLERLLHDDLRQIIAMHVSENSNSYRLATSALQTIIEENQHPAQVHVAYQGKPISL